MEQQKSREENKRRTKWVCEGFVWVEVLQVKMQSPSASLSACSWCATHANTGFACAKKPRVDVLWLPHRLSSLCVVNLSVICLSAHESSSSTTTTYLSDLICCFSNVIPAFSGLRCVSRSAGRG